MPKQELIKQGASNLGNRGDGANSRLQLAAEVATHLRGGVNPNVAENLQKVKEELERQVTGAPANVADVPEFNPETMPAATLEERKTQRAKEQSWGDWLYEKTITKAAKRVGIERPSQRQIEDQFDETQSSEVGDEKKSEPLVTSSSLATQKRSKRHRRAVSSPVVIGSISNQLVETGSPIYFAVDLQEIFDISLIQLDSVVVHQFPDVPLPSWLNAELKPGSLVMNNYNTPGYAGGVAISGNIVYVADWNLGLQIIDVSDLSNPILIGNYDTPGSAGDIVISGNLAIVADGSSGVIILDMSSQVNPILIGTYDTPGSAQALAISSTSALVADGDAGLYIIDVSNPFTPVVIGNYYMPGFASGLALVGNV